uniref:Uncharacterized protein n=1 Tax=Rhipicephalus zambeziensis TaxID=60191 RepID=A0A224YJY9_9ACAR
MVRHHLRRELSQVTNISMQLLIMNTPEAKAVARLVPHMMSRYDLWCSSYDCKCPTTIKGTCVDIATYFMDRKVVIFKGKQVTELVGNNPSLWFVK